MMKHPPAPTRLRRPIAARRRQAGLTLVEIVVSVMLGLLVLSGVFVAYIGTGVSDRQQRALARMTEDAQLAMTLLTRELQMAGYMQIQSAGSTTAQGVRQPTQGASFRAIHGCEHGFIDSKAAFAAADCMPPPGGAAAASMHAIEINHEVTAFTSHPDSSGKPTDCQGAAVDASGRVSNRFFVVQAGAVTAATYELSCASNFSAQAPLVPQVEAVNFRYGIAPGWSLSDPATWRPQRFLNADAVAASDWNQVVAVRVCLLMRSADPVLPAATPVTYVDCAGQRTTVPDRHLRRAFKSTVTLRNRVS